MKYTIEQLVKFAKNEMFEFALATEHQVDEVIDIFNEQGLGDSIQFSKYLIPLTKIAKKVTFIVQNNIQSLLKKQIENLSIETIETSKNNKYDFKNYFVIEAIHLLFRFSIKTN